MASSFKRGVFLYEGRPVVHSLFVAKKIDKDHKDLLKNIRTSIEKQGKEFSDINFVPSKYLDSINVERPAFLLTQAACAAVAEISKGPKATALKQTSTKLFDAYTRKHSSKALITPTEKPKTIDLGVFVKDGKVVVSSRTVAEVFEKRHDHVLQAIKDLNCGDEFNLPNFREIEYVDARGRTQPEILMTRDGLTLLAMSFTGARAMDFKIKYINVFNTMEAKLRASSNVPSIVPDFTDPDSSRRGWIVAVEKGLEFARALDVSEKKVALLTEQVKEAAPAVEFKKNLEAAPGSMDMTDCAAILSKKLGRPIGRNILEKYFRDKKIFIGGGVKDPERNRPSQAMRKAGYFEDALIEINLGKHVVRRYFQPFITYKGFVHFVDNGILQQESEKNQLLFLADDAHNDDKK